MVSYIAYLNLKFNLFKNYFLSDCCVFKVAGFYYIFALFMIPLMRGSIDCRGWQLSELIFSIIKMKGTLKTFRFPSLHPRDPLHDQLP